MESVIPIKASVRVTEPLSAFKGDEGVVIGHDSRTRGYLDVIVRLRNQPWPFGKRGIRFTSHELTII